MLFVLLHISLLIVNISMVLNKQNYFTFSKCNNLAIWDILYISNSNSKFQIYELF